MTDLPIRPLSNLEKVKHFHQVFGHPVSDHINVATDKLNRLRIRLIAEELGELCDALGYSLSLITDGQGTHSIDLTPSGATPNPVEVADALADIEYVTLGAYLVFGLPGQRLFNEVHDSNMSKLGADGKPIYDDHGKVMKGPNTRKPDILKVLLAYNPDDTEREIPFTDISFAES